MNMNPHLSARIAGIQKILMAHHAAGLGMPNAMIGAEREVLVGEFLGKVFPSHRRFTTGSITDSKGFLTGQVDVAIEYGFFPSFPTPNGGPRLLLAESVAAVIEVKSDLVAQWDEVVSKTKDVRNIMRLLEPLYGEEPGQQIPCIAVGYKGYGGFASLTRRLQSTEEEGRPDAALVIESGAFSSQKLRAEGPEGLYALCVYINKIFEKVGFARADLFKYVSANTLLGPHILDELLDD